MVALLANGMADIPDDQLTVSAIAQHFSDEEAAYLYLEHTRWPDGPVCPHCGAAGHAYYLAPQSGQRMTRTGKPSYRRLWKCGECRQPFSVLVGTIFEDSHIPISKWLLAFHMVCAGKNGVSALELSRTLGLAYRTAWFMAHRIRYVLARPDGPSLDAADKLDGTVEADETYIGGKHQGKRGRGALGKTPVFTLVERSGEARSQVMEHVTSANVREVLTAQADTSAVLMTDTLPVYQQPGQEFAAHETVDHSQDEYARDTPHGRAYTNTAEGFFSQLKRSIDGTYHHVSAWHLHRYLAEFDYRYTTRKVKDGERTVKAIRQTAGKRLMYQRPAPALTD